MLSILRRCLSFGDAVIFIPQESCKRLIFQEACRRVDASSTNETVAAVVLLYVNHCKSKHVWKQQSCTGIGANTVAGLVQHYREVTAARRRIGRAPRQIQWRLKMKQKH